MNKLIYKTALITLAAIVAIGLVVFSLWILISPQTMAGVCEKTGNYSFAVTCADLRYKYTKNTDDLARCTEDSIQCGKDKLIVKYGEQLVSAEDYEEVCSVKDKALEKNKDELAKFISKYCEKLNLSQDEYDKLLNTMFISYDSYIKGNLSASQYICGETDKAIETVKSDTSGQSLVKLVIAVSDKSDKEAAAKLLKVLKDYNQTEQITNLTAILVKI